MNVENLMWHAADGKCCKVGELQIDHFVNVLNWITNFDKRYPIEFVQSMETYAEVRAFEMFSNNEPYPQKDENGMWRVVDGAMRDANGPPVEYVEAIREKYGVDHAYQINNPNGSLSWTTT